MTNQGEPLPLVIVDDGRMKFNRGNLKQVLDKTGEKPLVIYCVAGEFRKGKSFLLNLFLFFNHHKKREQDWTNSTDQITGSYNYKS